MHTEGVTEEMQVQVLVESGFFCGPFERAFEILPLLVGFGIGEYLQLLV